MMIGKKEERPQLPNTVEALAKTVMYVGDNVQLLKTRDCKEYLYWEGYVLDLGDDFKAKVKQVRSCFKFLGIEPKLKVLNLS